MRRISVFLTVLILMSMSSEVIIKLRRTYYKALKNEKSIETFFNLGEKHQKTALGKAYFGTAKALKARESSWVPTKVSLANEASGLLNNAVKQDPKSTEIRFLRLSFESATPSMLGINEHVQDDIDFLSTHLEKKHPIKHIISAWLAKTDDISESALNRIKARL